MKISSKVWIIILAVTFGLSVIYNIDQHSTLNSYKKQLDQEKQRKEKIYEKKTKEAEDHSKASEESEQSANEDLETAKDLEEQKNNLKNEEYEKAPYLINDADSLYGIISRRFD